MNTLLSNSPRGFQVRGLLVGLALLVGVVGCGGTNQVVASTGCAPAEPVTAPAGGLAFRDVSERLGEAPYPQWQGLAEDFSINAENDEELARQIREEVAIMSGAASITDLDGDGFDDIYLPRVGLPNVMLMNRCGLSFDDEASDRGIDAQGAGGAAVFFDIDGDGDEDLFASSLVPGSSSLYVNLGDGTFRDEAEERGLLSPVDAGGHAYSTTVMDIEPDGDLDLLVSRWQRFSDDMSAGRSQLFINDGRGHFVDDTDGLGLRFGDVAAFTAIAADVRGDAALELLVAADWESSRLFERQNDTFVDVARATGSGTDQNGMGAVAADLDNDLDLDWFVSSIHCGRPHAGELFGCSGNRYYQRQADGTFVDIAAQVGLDDAGWGWGVVAADLDTDGDLDLGVTNGFRSPHSAGPTPELYERYLNDQTKLWRNDGDDVWQDVSAQAGLAVRDNGKGFFTFDFDRDGDLDLLNVRTVDGPVLYENQSARAGSWLQIDLDADTAPVVGAVVVIDDGTHKQRRDWLVSGFQGHGAMTLHFGFDRHIDEVASITVSWPDGSETVLSDVQTGRRVTISR